MERESVFEKVILEQRLEGDEKVGSVTMCGGVGGGRLSFLTTTP